MLTSIFHPRQPKTPLDFLTIASLSFQILAYFLLSRTVAKVFFVVYFAFWRSAYNAGLGWVLKQQSERGWIVKMVKRHGWMDEKKRPKVRAWVKQQLVVKMDKDYNFEVCPTAHRLLTPGGTQACIGRKITAMSLFPCCPTCTYATNAKLPQRANSPARRCHLTTTSG